MLNCRTTQAMLVNDSWYRLLKLQKNGLSGTATMKKITYLLYIIENYLFLPQVVNKYFL